LALQLRIVSPEICRPGFGDHVTALATLSGVLAAVHERNTTGNAGWWRLRYCGGISGAGAGFLGTQYLIGFN
jgi:hypothetical protein